MRRSFMFLPVFSSNRLRILNGSSVPRSEDACMNTHDFGVALFF
ncbi:MAG: hypothetical protein ACYC3G_02095 [Minisyncoccota bacterium]